MLHIERKKLLFAFLALVMALQPMMSAGMVVYAQESAGTDVVSAEAEKQVKVAIISTMLWIHSVRKPERRPFRLPRQRNPECLRRSTRF